MSACTPEEALLHSLFGSPGRGPEDGPEQLPEPPAGALATPEQDQSDHHQCCQQKHDEAHVSTKRASLATSTVYEDLRAAEAAGTPYEVIQAAAEGLNVEYVDELDI
jgi:hypothetical protein